MGCYVPVPQPSISPRANTQLAAECRHNFQTNGRDLCTRDTRRHIRVDRLACVWIGTNVAMRLDAPRLAVRLRSISGRRGSTEIYTNPGTNLPM